MIDGLDADVVTLALAYDIDSIQRKGKRLGANWQTRFRTTARRTRRPSCSSCAPAIRSTFAIGPISAQPGITIVTPNPKTSGGARWNYLAAWGYAMRTSLGGDLGKLDDPASADAVKAAEASAEQFVKELYKRVPVLDGGARASTNTFVQREIGDVLLAWENEALLAMRELKPGTVEIVVPSVSILAEPPVAVVDTVVDRRGTRQVAEAYLQYLYTNEGQEIAAEHYFRPRNPEILERNRDKFPQIELFTIARSLYGDWNKAHEVHFADGGVFDRIYGIK